MDYNSLPHLCGVGGLCSGHLGFGGVDCSCISVGCSCGCSSEIGRFCKGCDGVRLVWADHCTSLGCYWSQLASHELELRYFALCRYNEALRLFFGVVLDMGRRNLDFNGAFELAIKLLSVFCQVSLHSVSQYFYCILLYRHQQILNAWRLSATHGDRKVSHGRCPGPTNLDKQFY